METKTLQTQLLEFQKKVNVIKKDAKNPHFKNTYASLTQIISEVKPILSEVGIVLTQPLINGNVSTFLTYGSSPMREVLESSLPLPVGLQPQPLGSAITYFRRYTLASLLALEIDDDDANEATKKEQPKFQATATELPPLSDKAFAAMLDAIAKGEKDKVKAAMTKYTLLKPQLDELTKLLN